MLTWDGISAAITFSAPFVVAVAINLQTSAVLTVVLAAVLLPTGLLSFCLREKLTLPPWMTAPICALAASGITAFAAVLIRQYFPQVNDTVGMYLYLLAAYPVISAVFYGKKAGKATTALAWSLRNILYFGLFTGLAGLIRGFLAYNKLFGMDLSLGLKLEGAKATFFGFIVFGFILAGTAALRMAVIGHKAPPDPEEDEEYSAIELRDIVRAKEETP